MKNTYLVKILATFTTEELDNLYHFLHCKAFNANNRACQLFDFIRQYAPTYQDNNLTDQAAFDFINPPKVKDSIAFIIKLRSVLLDLVEQYICLCLQKSTSKNTDLLNFYVDREILDVYNKTRKQIIHNSKSILIKDDSYYLENLQREQIHTHYQSRFKDKRKGDVNMQTTMDALDRYYIIQKLELLCHARNRQQTVPITYHFGLEDELLLYIKQSEHIEDTTVQLWYNLLLLLKTPNDEELYLKLKEGLGVAATILSLEMLSNHYILLENIAKSIFSGIAYYQELFDLYEAKLNAPNQIAFPNGFIHPDVFYNMVSIAFNLNKLAWAGGFVKDNEDKLMPETPKSKVVYDICCAMIALEMKDNNKAFILAFNATPQDINYKMTRYRLLIKVRYQDKTNNKRIDALEADIATFTAFLFANKEKIFSDVLQKNRKFNNLVKALYQSSKTKRAALEKGIMQLADSDVVDKIWLLKAARNEV